MNAFKMLKAKLVLELKVMIWNRFKKVLPFCSPKGKSLPLHFERGQKEKLMKNLHFWSKTPSCRFFVLGVFHRELQKSEDKFSSGN